MQLPQSDLPEVFLGNHSCRIYPLSVKSKGLEVMSLITISRYIRWYISEWAIASVPTLSYCQSG